MNCANECTSLDCRFQCTQEWAANTKAWRGCACEWYSTLQSALYSAAQLRCIWFLSLGQLMAHCEENVPRRKRTEIKWAASLPSLVWLVVLSRRLTLRGTLSLASVSISAPRMMQGNDMHLWQPRASFSMLLLSAEYPTSWARLSHYLIIARGVFCHQTQ